MMGVSSESQNFLKRIPRKIAHFRIATGMRASRERIRMLVVEDQLFSRKLLEEVLRHHGAVDLVATAGEGLDLFLDGAPDIVFLDIDLVGQSGHTLAQIIKTVDPETFVVMVTGNSSVEDVALAKSNKVEKFVSKPYNKSKILDCLEEYYKRHPNRRPKG